MTKIQFLAGREAITEQLSKLIEQQPESEPLLLLVAYWGQGAEALFLPNKNYKVVCNLSDGGTNPVVIESLLASRHFNIEQRHHPRLHAKVAFGKQGALVSSANFSANGLCINNQTGNLEAGTFIPLESDAHNAVRSWAWDVWRQSEEVDSAALQVAKVSYVQRGSGKLGNETGDLALASGETTLPQLKESELFASDDPNSRNALRTGSKQLLARYRDMVGDTGDGKEGLICAYAANLLWTHIGNSMEWRDGKFNLPHQVVNRWRDVKTIKDEEVQEFLSWLAKSNIEMKRISLIAMDLLERSWYDYTQGEL